MANLLISPHFFGIIQVDIDKLRNIDIHAQK